MNDQNVSDVMPLYEGTKRLRARPMTRGEYNDYRGWQTPGNENRDDAGYLVEYEDGGKSNDPRHAGYVSWSPKDVFDRTYRRIGVSRPSADPIDNENQVKGLAAPRVMPADLEAEIVAEHYFTARDGAEGACGIGGGPYSVSLGLLTFCVLVLRNGFTVTAESACVSPENFNAELGQKIARAKAVEKIWPLLGFRLRDRLTMESGHA